MLLLTLVESRGRTRMMRRGFIPISTAAVPSAPVTHEVHEYGRCACRGPAVICTRHYWVAACCCDGAFESSTGQSYCIFASLTVRK